MNNWLKSGLILIITLFSVLSFPVKTYDQNSTLPPPDTAQRLTLLFVGDIMGHDSQINAAYNPATKTYEYDSCFKFVSPLISSYDIAIANLEVTLAGPPYKGYPQFSSHDNLAVAVKNAGFDILLTANNHSCDRGRKGIERTIRILDSLDIPHTGTFVDTSVRRLTYPMIIEKNGIKIALLNYTYGTNGIEIPKPNVVNMIEEKQIKADLKAARDSMPDKIIVCTHWGDEYKLHPNTWQKNYAKICFDNGADIVIGSHPHVLQKIERKHYPDSNGREVMIVYSLGNYISNQRDRYKDGGATLGFELIKKDGKTEINFAGHYFTWVWITYVEGRKQYYILPVSEFENTEDILDDASMTKMKLFASDSRSLYGDYNINVREFIYDNKAKTWTQQPNNPITQ